MGRLLAILFIIFLPGALLTGCGVTGSAPESYLREEVDFTFIERIAVLPFQNNSDDDYAPVRTRDIVLTQVLAMGLFDVVEKDLVDSALREELISPDTEIDSLALKRLGSRLRVQAVLLGTVDMAGMSKVGTTAAPEVALTLRLVETNSGMVLWQASGHRSAESMTNRLLGIKGDNMYGVTLKLVRSLLRTFDI